MENVWLACGVLLQLFALAAGEANSFVEDAKKLSVPNFLPTNTNFQKNVGDTAVLECAVENLGKKNVSWRKVSSGKILTVGFMSFSGDSRMEVEHPPGSSFWNLVIRDLKLEDAGVYECQISSKVRHLRHHVTLLVKDPPKKKKQNIRITGTDIVDEGKRLYLICNATSTEQPPDDLDWFRSGDRLQTSKDKGVYIRKFVTLSTATIVSILEIKQARLQDAGVYVCRTSSLDVTSFHVEVLKGDKNQNVKRDRETASTRSEWQTSYRTVTETPSLDTHVENELNGGLLDWHRQWTEVDHTEETSHHVGSAAPDTRHQLVISVSFAVTSLLLSYLPSKVT